MRYTQQEICMMNRLRQLWEQHVYWTRFFIISTAADLGDLKPVTDRLLQNPGDFERALAPFYGPQKAWHFQELLTQHLHIAGDLVNALKQQETVKANELRRSWYQNADEIAAFLSCVNRCCDQTTWKTMMYRHLQMTEQEATLRLQGQYAEDVKLFDQIESEALEMADAMAGGIRAQCFRQ